MSRTAELRLRIDPDLKERATALYGRWGLSLADAVTVFLNQSIYAGGMPFEMHAGPQIDWNGPNIVGPDPKHGVTLFAADTDCPEDEIYETYVS